MEYPKTQMDFEKTFFSEEQCTQYLMGLKWPDGFRCPNCGNNTYWKTKSKLKCKKCEHRTSVTTDTIFHRSKKPLMIYFRAIWWMIAQKNGVSATGLAKILGLKNYHIAWTWLHKFRRLMVVPDRKKLTGRVEIDECFVGGVKSGKSGRGALGKVLVIIAVEEKGRGTGRVRMAIIPSATYANIRKFITENIETGSIIVSDGLPSYKKIINDGYLHEVEIQTKELDENNLHVLPRVHIVISLLKRWLLGTHQGFAKKQQLEYYLDEFVFRYNRRNAKSRGLLFHRLLEQAVKHKPVTYRDIIGNKAKN